MGSSQSALVQQVVNTIKQFGYHPATVFFVVVGIVACLTIFALAIWRHKKALDVSAPLRAAKVLRKATQQDAYIKYAQIRLPQPTALPAPIPPSVPTFSHVNENLGTMGILHSGCPPPLHHSAIVPPLKTYSHQLLLFSMATMVWSAHPIRSITLLHNENMATSYADLVWLSQDADRELESAYSIARRSLRLWPVSMEGNLKERTVEFLVNELLLDQQFASDLVFEVKRAGRPKSRDQTSQAICDEVLVRFESSRDRDDVKSYAKNLERKGRGVRLKIPDALWPSFRVLQDLGYEQRQKYKNLKRNVLFR